MTLKFLTALNKMFKRGILSREHVISDNSPVLKRMDEGYSFFTCWCNDVIKNGVDPKSNDQKPFLAWQVCIA